MQRAHSCARPGCAEPPASLLGYRYADRVAWLADFDGSAPPWVHPLCTAHADTLKVPLGWTLEDRRRPAGAYHPPIAV